MSVMTESQSIIDLSTPLYDGIRGLTTEPDTSIEVEGYNTTMLHLYSHTDTHMDAPKHFVAGGGAIDQVNLQACVGTARVIDVTAVEANGVICIADLGAAAARIGAGSRVLLRTDWHRHVDADDFRSHMPRVSLQLAQWLLQRQVALLGMEQPSVASVRPENRQELTDVHRALLQGGVVIVEGLYNLDQLKQEQVQFVALPLRLRDCDGSPVRAIAIEKSSGGVS